MQNVKIVFRMKKYIKPKTRIVSIEEEIIMTPWSQMKTGGTYDRPPEMGHDGEPWEGL